ncbi:hypothetical protein C8T65DRAFT_574028 [Cerioporus squamosus]|nr:hypothetical protein C8T65DRAFT_574028 [Cerioporus squamosus]
MSHTVSRRPHPILKRDSSPFKDVLPFTSCGSTMFSPHVHFPPTPRMIAATYPAHSPTTYDRKPIVVSPNVVQLPQRGSRTLSTPGPSADFDGDYFHPRAYEACNPEPLSAASSSFDLPSLVQDLSPSDESDDIVTPPGGNIGSPGKHVSLGHAISLHLPDAQKVRHSPLAEPEHAGSPSFRSVHSPPPRPRPHGKARPNFARNERQLCGKPSFSPDLDEGCLGGF